MFTLLAGAASALFLVGAAGADRTTSFSDPVGDAGKALDIRRVDVSEYQGWDGHRALEFTATVAGPVYCSSDGDGVQIVVALDLDQNPDTGSAFYGTEVELAPDSIGDATFLRASGWGFRGGSPPEGIGWGCGPHTMGYSVDGTALGLAPNAGFNVVVATMRPHTDTAPDVRTYNYQPVPRTRLRLSGRTPVRPTSWRFRRTAFTAASRGSATGRSRVEARPPTRSASTSAAGCWRPFGGRCTTRTCSRTPL